jgi:hypothetical protein
MRKPKAVITEITRSRSHSQKAHRPYPDGAPFQIDEKNTVKALVIFVPVVVWARLTLISY